MSQITTGSTIICGENQAANRIFPVQFGPAPGELATLTVIHKETLRAYEIEVGNCKGTKNYPTAIDWTGTNGTASAPFAATPQPYRKPVTAGNAATGTAAACTFRAPIR